MIAPFQILKLFPNTTIETLHLEGDSGGNIGLGHSLGQFLLGHIEVGHVGVVVLAVVELHDLGADDGLQGVVVIGQVGEGVLAPDADNKEMEALINMRYVDTWCGQLWRTVCRPVLQVC